MSRLVFYAFLVTIVSVVGDRVDCDCVPVNGTTNSTLFCHEIEACYDRIEVFGGVFRCKKFYATLDPDEPCMYDRKSRMILVLVEFFFGWMGAGSFYLEWFEIAVYRMLVFVVMMSLLMLRDWSECLGDMIAALFCLNAIVWVFCLTWAMDSRVHDSHWIGVYSL